MIGNIQNPPTCKIWNDDTDHGSDADSVAELEYKTWEDACAWECQSVLLRFNQNRPTDILYPALISCRQTKDMDCLTHAVCYDCICLMLLLRSTITLFSEGDRTVAIT